MQASPHAGPDRVPSADHGLSRALKATMTVRKTSAREAVSASNAGSVANNAAENRIDDRRLSQPPRCCPSEAQRMHSHPKPKPWNHFRPSTVDRG